MAINPRTDLENRNHLYLACSGGGKSQALRQNPDIPGRGARVLLWDIDHDHQGQHFEEIRDFLKAVRAGIRSGRGFRIGYCGADTPENFEAFCAIVWAVLDGTQATHVIIEELADAAPSTGKALPNFGRLLRKGRKFNARLHVTSQRGAEIPKTAYTQCLYKYIGQQEGSDVKRMADIAGVSPGEIKQLNPLEFFLKSPGPEPGRKIKLKFKPKPATVAAVNTAKNPKGPG
jgi:hypothetical protein